MNFPLDYLKADFSFIKMNFLVFKIYIQPLALVLLLNFMIQHYDKHTQIFRMSLRRRTMYLTPLTCHFILLAFHFTLLKHPKQKAPSILHLQ